jgi:hypothetical protein
MAGARPPGDPTGVGGTSPRLGLRHVIDTWGHPQKSSDRTRATDGLTRIGAHLPGRLEAVEVFA